METIQVLDHNADINGTCLQAEVYNITYATIIKLFGKHIKGNYKTDAEWYIKTPFGIGTIYNYKDGKNYNGKNGLRLKDIVEWHIGGKNLETGLIIKTALESFNAGYNSK